MRLGRCVLALALLLGVAGTAGAAPTPQERREALVLSNKARAAMWGKRFDEAADLLRQANSIEPTPQRRLDLSRALVETGKLVEASQLLNAMASDTTMGPKGRYYQAAAKKQLAQFESRIPWLSVHVIGPSAGAHVEIDGQEVQPDIESPVDPGAHNIGVDADGYSSGDRRVTVAEGEHKQVTITLDALAKPPPPPPPSSGGTKAPAIVAFSVGAVGIGVGAAFGVLAFDETARAKQYCDGNKCPAIKEVVDARNTAIANGNVSTVGFVIGGVGVAAGVILLLTVGSSSDKAPPPTETGFVLPYVNAGENSGEFGLIGRF
ncbi:MAG: tetratricopeptide repeat protein [Polyangiaceae bacterium]